MTKKELEQYRALCREIKYFSHKLKRLKNDKLSDTVLSSGSGPDYMQREISIFGPTADYKSLQDKYNNRVKRAAAARDAIEAYIDNIADSHMRQIIYLRFIDGKSWQAIASIIGGGNTADGVRKACDRYIISCPFCPENM